LWNDARGGKSNAEILRELRPIQNADLSVAPFYLEEAAKSSWQWGITIDGQWIAGMAIVPGDRPGTAWFSGFTGMGLTSFWQVRPMFDKWRDLTRLGPYDEIRAWIHWGDERDETFAKRFGFRLDCGPASAFSPAGHDMGLWLWRR
jgi:hypothetical protein